MSLPRTPPPLRPKNRKVSGLESAEQDEASVNRKTKIIRFVDPKPRRRATPSHVLFLALLHSPSPMSITLDASITISDSNPNPNPVPLSTSIPTTTATATTATTATAPIAAIAAACAPVLNRNAGYSCSFHSQKHGHEGIYPEASNAENRDPGRRNVGYPGAQCHASKLLFSSRRSIHIQLIILPRAPRLSLRISLLLSTAPRVILDPLRVLHPHLLYMPWQLLALT